MKECEQEVKGLKSHIEEEDNLGGGDTEGLKYMLSQLKTEKSRLLDELNASEVEGQDGFANMRKTPEERTTD